MHEYYSVARFKATYAHALPALEGKQQWDIVNPGFKLCAPVLKRVAGRPRKSRIRPRSEGAGLGARRRKCTRCGGTGHFAKYCDNAVDPAFGECFDDENDAQQPHDFANDAPSGDQNDDHNDAPIEAHNDDQIDDQNDDPTEPLNDEQDDDPFEAHNDDQIDDQNVEQKDDPIDLIVELNDGPIEAPNNAPNDGDQPSVVVSYAWYVNLANTILHFSLDMISQPPLCFV